ncbi:MAG: two pore domain potassium channel family protein [Planctomycetes bacterium]|nr:two pore domain potassium channel family protein [Planctomycetota bacterium]
MTSSPTLPSAPGRPLASAGLDDLAGRLRQEPLRNLLGLLGVCTFIFYKAEKGRNPKVNSFWDALIYCTTCASVGYGDVFAQTPTGKAVGSLLFTLGPALTSMALDGPSPSRSDKVQEEILTTLQNILAELRARGNDTGPQA